MPTAFEYRETHKVLGAFLHVDATTPHWSLGLRNLRPGPDEMPFLPITGRPYDHARNDACRMFLETDYQYLFFLDSDVIPPSDAVYRLLAHKLPFVSGMYCRRSPPHAVPVMIKDGQWVANPTGGLMEVDLVGAGCLLIHRSVLEKLPPQRPGHHWFDWRVNYRGLGLPNLPDEDCMSEDFTLCVHARKHGIRTIVDTSIRCKHVGLGESDLGTFLPAEARPHT